MALESRRCITFVGCCYDLTPAVFAKWLVKQADSIGVRIQGVIVSNQSSHSLESGYPFIRVATGSNKYLDFSGYFEGLKLLKAEVTEKSDVFLFVNDSLILKHSGSTILRKTLDQAMLCNQIRTSAIAGKGFNYTSICLRNPWGDTNIYISTFCFLLNRKGYDVFNRLLDFALEDGIVTDKGLEDDDWGVGIDISFREFVRAHLIYKNTPYLWRRTTNEHEEEVLVQKKAVCVYFEHRLTGAIGKSGCLLPINSGFKSKTIIFLCEQIAQLLRPLLRFALFPSII